MTIRGTTSGTDHHVPGKARERPRPIVLGDVKEFAAYVDRIHRQFERLGVLHGIDTPALAGTEGSDA